MRGTNDYFTGGTDQRIKKVTWNEKSFAEGRFHYEHGSYL